MTSLLLHNATLIDATGPGSSRSVRPEPVEGPPSRQRILSAVLPQKDEVEGRAHRAKGAAVDI